MSVDAAIDPAALLDALARLGRLMIPAALGALLAHRGLLGDPRRAVVALNGFALYIGFPALVIAGLADRAIALPSGIGIWVVVPAAALGSMAIARVLARASPVPEDRGTLPLIALFGNVAYLGLPWVIALYGTEIQGTAALAVSIYVAISVGLGPIVLSRWGRPGAKTAGTLKHVLRLPLFWAPWIGLLLRIAPQPIRSGTLTAIMPLSHAAGPIALFLLGVYIYVERRRILAIDRGVVLHAVLRLAIGPGLMAGICAIAMAFNGLDPKSVPVLITLAAMPAAITTFSIAHDAGIGATRVATTIVVTTLASAITLPIVAALIG